MVRGIGQVPFADRTPARLDVWSAPVNTSIKIVAAVVYLFEQAFDHSRRDQTRHPRPPPLLIFSETDSTDYGTNS